MFKNKISKSTNLLQVKILNEINKPSCSSVWLTADCDEMKLPQERASSSTQRTNILPQKEKRRKIVKISKIPTLIE